MIYILHRVVHAIAVIAPTLQPVPPSTYTPPTETLVAAGNDGTITVRPGLSHHLCAESVNIALYGMTLEQSKDWQKEQHDALAEISVISKPHRPTTDEEKECFTLLKYNHIEIAGQGYCGGISNPRVDLKAGTIAEDSMELVSPTGQTYQVYSIDGNLGATGSAYDSTIKKALCIP